MELLQTPCVKCIRKTISVTHTGLLNKEWNSPVVQIASFSRMRVNFLPMTLQLPLQLHSELSTYRVDRVYQAIPKQEQT
jgi:hypothetical protein